MLFVCLSQFMQRIIPKVYAHKGENLFNCWLLFSHFHDYGFNSLKFRLFANKTSHTLHWLVELFSHNGIFLSPSFICSRKKNNNFAMAPLFSHFLRPITPFHQFASIENVVTFGNIQQIENDSFASRKKRKKISSLCKSMIKEDTMLRYHAVPFRLLFFFLLLLFLRVFLWLYPLIAIWKKRKPTTTLIILFFFYSSWFVVFGTT